MGAVRGVVDSFMDTATPIKHLEKAAKAAIGNSKVYNKLKMI